MPASSSEKTWLTNLVFHFALAARKLGTRFKAPSQVIAYHLVTETFPFSQVLVICISSFINVFFLRQPKFLNGRSML